MATVHYSAFPAIILVFQVYSVTANISIPFLSPLLGNSNPCRESVCGKGNCVFSSNSTFGYECECDSGWKQAGPQDDEYLKFLPCVIPNCTLDYDCANAPAPPASGLIAEVVRAIKRRFSHTLVNVRRVTTICSIPLLSHATRNILKFCGAFGLDCTSLGLGINNSTTLRPDTSPSSASDSKSSHSVSLIPRVEYGWLIGLSTTLALVLLWQCV
ncbi:hypothetical protein OROGR_014330 [Orobanche gracilis]